MDIRFVSYDGKWPNLCSGNLTLLVDGVQMTFGKSEQFPCFWVTGGAVWFDEHWNEHVDKGDWIINEDELPDKLKLYAAEIGRIFNENVPHGCCGGCV